MTTNDVKIEAFSIGKVIEERQAAETQARAIREGAVKAGRKMTEEERAEFNRLAGRAQAFDELEGKMTQHTEEGFMAPNTIVSKRDFHPDDIGRAVLATGLPPEEKRSVSLSSGHVLNPSVIDTGNFVMALKEHEFISKTGLQVLNLKNFHQWPVETGSASATWQSAEGASVTPSTGLTIGSKKVEKKTFAYIIKYSKQLQRDEKMTPTLIRRALINGVVAELQRVLLSGASGSNEPVGIDNVSGVATVDCAGTISSYAKIIDCVTTLHANNVDPSRLSFVTGTTAMGQIISLADSTGQPLMPPPVIKDIPFYYSSSVLETYDTNTHTRGYMADWSQGVLAIDGPHFENWTQRYGDELNNAILMWMGVDFVALRPDNFCMLQNIDLA